MPSPMSKGVTCAMLTIHSFVGGKDLPTKQTLLKKCVCVYYMYTMMMNIHSQHPSLNYFYVNLCTLFRSTDNFLLFYIY